MKSCKGFDLSYSTCNFWSRAVGAQNQAYQKVSESWVSKDHLQRGFWCSLPNTPILIQLQFDQKETGQSSQSKSLWNSKGKGGRERGKTAKIHLLSKVLQQLIPSSWSSPWWKPVNAFLKRFATQRTDFQISCIISSSSKARTRIFAWAYLSWANSLYSENWPPLSQISLRSSQVSANHYQFNTTAARDKKNKVIVNIFPLQKCDCPDHLRDKSCFFRIMAENLTLPTAEETVQYSSGRC